MVPLCMAWVTLTRGPSQTWIAVGRPPSLTITIEIHGLPWTTMRLKRNILDGQLCPSTWSTPNGMVLLYESPSKAIKVHKTGEKFVHELPWISNPEMAHPRTKIREEAPPPGTILHELSWKSMLCTMKIHGYTWMFMDFHDKIWLVIWTLKSNLLLDFFWVFLHSRKWQLRRYESQSFLDIKPDPRLKQFPVNWPPQSTDTPNGTQTDTPNDTPQTAVYTAGTL